IHKADLPGAEAVEGQVRSMLTLSDREAPAILRVSAHTGAGVEALWSAITGRPLRRPATDPGARDLLQLAQELLRTRFAAAEPAAATGRRCCARTPPAPPHATPTPSSTP